MDSLSPLPGGVRRQPKQRRSRTLVAAIREACLRILESGDSEPLTAKRIAETAGVTIGSFYQYFPNKEAVLLDVLMEQAPGEADRIAAETRYVHTLSRESLGATLRELVHLTCERHLRMLKLHGDVYRRYHRQLDFQNLVNISVRKYIEVTSWQDWVRNLLERHRASIDCDALDIAAYLVATAIVNLTADAVDNAPELLRSDAFREQLTKLLLNYLGVRDSAPAATEPTRPTQP